MATSTGRYSLWIRRAEAFVRQLNYLTGTWGISIAIDAPLPESEADDLARLLPFGLPSPLRELYTHGSANCRCRYHWSPDQEQLLQVQTVFPHQMSLYGGPEFVPWTELPVAHEIHSFWDGEDENLTEAQAIAVKVWRQTIPFINVGNGDCVALHVTEDPLVMPVVYLSHDDPETPVTNLSPSLDQFLADWESLCYVGPEIWLLAAFLGEDGRGPLNVEESNAQRWREIIRGKQKPETGTA